MNPNINSPTAHPKVKLIIYDFDGVLTDNRVYLSDEGHETVACNRTDGWWIGQIRQKAPHIEQIILSSEKNPVVSHRAKKLKLECHQGFEVKLPTLIKILESKKVAPEEVVYVGNDTNDLQCLQFVGYPMAPLDANPSILPYVQILLPEKGGAGIVPHVYHWLERNGQIATSTQTESSVILGAPTRKLDIACIVPARGGSKGIPKKNIMPIAGKPLLEWTLNRALQTSSINAGVFVSSDSTEILSLTEKLGARSIQRPDSLSGDTASSEVALVHALDAIKSHNGKDPDYLVFLQNTSPLRKPDDLAKAIQQVVESGADSLFSAAPVKDHFLWERDPAGQMRSYTYDYRRRLRRQDLPTRYWENGSIYIFRPSILRDLGNRLGGQIEVYEMDEIHSLQIDEHEDAALCEYFLKKLYC